MTCLDTRKSNVPENIQQKMENVPKGIGEGINGWKGIVDLASPISAIGKETRSATSEGIKFDYRVRTMDGKLKFSLTMGARMYARRSVAYLLSGSSEPLRDMDILYKGHGQLLVRPSEGYFFVEVRLPIPSQQH